MGEHPVMVASPLQGLLGDFCCLVKEGAAFSFCRRLLRFGDACVLQCKTTDCQELINKSKFKSYLAIIPNTLIRLFLVACCSFKYTAVSRG